MRAATNMISTPNTVRYRDGSDRRSRESHEPAIAPKGAPIPNENASGHITLPCFRYMGTETTRLVNSRI